MVKITETIVDRVAKLILAVRWRRLETGLLGPILPPDGPDPSIEEEARAIIEIVERELSAGWHDIELLPADDRLILAYCPPCGEFVEGRMMIWRAKFLRAQGKTTPQHLRFPATRWRALPAPPVV